MFEAVATHTPAVDPRAHYERMLATLLDRSNPESPNYRPEFAASSQAEARLLMRALEKMDDHQLAAAVAPVQPPAELHPREQGRFTPGNPGGPGRPRKIHCVEHDSVTIVANAISPQDLHDITRVAVAQAKEGDGGARRWIYQMVYRHSRTSINEVAALQETGISRDEHRMLLAQKHYGREMEDIELYRQEVEAVAQAELSEPPAAPEAVVVAEAAAVEAPAADVAVPEDGVLEVRLAPARDADARSELSGSSFGRGASAQAGVPAEKNAQKRSKTVENGRNGHGRSTCHGRAEPQVA